MVEDGGQDREPGTGDPEVGPPQHLLVIDGGRHAPQYAAFLESIKFD